MAREKRATVRMEPIATLPVFFKLGGKRAVLAGGLEPAAWKAELLSAAGALVEVFAAEPCAAVLAVAAAPPAGSITIVPRDWQPADLVGAAIALAAIEDDTEAARFQAAAKAAGVPVNVIDKPAFCDFQFGTIVSRSPLVVGISTDGAAPVFGQAIRARIEALLPQVFRAWAEAARDWRPAVQALGLDFRARRRFWEVFTDRAFAATDRGPTADDLAACRATVSASDVALPTSMILVAAGSGSPGAVTLDAIRALQDADIVFHDADVSATVVSYARREAEKIALEDGADTQSAGTILDRLAPGRKLCWLGSGSLEGCVRTLERIALLHKPGIAVSAVEGVGRCRSCRPACPGWRAA